MAVVRVMTLWLCEAERHVTAALYVDACVWALVVRDRTGGNGGGGGGVLVSHSLAAGGSERRCAHSFSYSYTHRKDTVLAWLRV